MHLIVCPPSPDKIEVTTVAPITTAAEVEDFDDTNHTTSSDAGLSPHTLHGTFPSGLKCTWERSRKTTALTHYYEYDKKSKKTTANTIKVETTTATQQVDSKTTNKPKDVDDVDSLAQDDQSDGEESSDVFRSAVLALVRESRGDGETFGCTLTAITEYWTLTAASCIEAIEEVDSLDNFVILERYGEVARGRSHALADVRPHPHYAGANRSYDLAALRSQAPLRAVNTLRLPDLVDYFLITMGEGLTLFGFGAFRNSDSKSGDRRVREVRVYVLPAKACATAGDEETEADAEAGAWSVRHLARGRALQHGGCGAAPLCAGVLYARGEACRYCAGSPLLRGDTLLGVMSDARRCGVACEPTVYVNIVLVRDWIDMIIGDE